MKLEVKDGTTGESIILNTEHLIEFNLIPENVYEQEQTFWGSRMSVKGFISNLKKQSDNINGSPSTT